MTNRDKIKSNLKKITKSYGVKFISNKRLPFSGADGKNGIIYVQYSKDYNEYISIAMHELQHVINYRNKKYPKYHGHEAKIGFSKAVVYHGIQAERYTDKHARVLTKVHFPEVIYKSIYDKKSGRIWYYNFMTLHHKNEIRKFLANKSENLPE